MPLRVVAGPGAQGRPFKLLTRKIDPNWQNWCWNRTNYSVQRALRLPQSPYQRRAAVWVDLEQITFSLPSSMLEIVPSPSRSNIWNTSLNSAICSSVNDSAIFLNYEGVTRRKTEQAKNVQKRESEWECINKDFVACDRTDVCFFFNKYKISSIMSFKIL